MRSRKFLIGLIFCALIVGFSNVFICYVTDHGLHDLYALIRPMAVVLSVSSCVFGILQVFFLDEMDG